MNAKEFLEDVRKSVVKESLVLERLHRARDRVDALGAVQYRDMPGNPNANPDGVINAIIKRTNIEEQVAAELAVIAMRAEQCYGMFCMLNIDNVVDAETIDECEMYYLHGMSSKEIAEICCRTESSVRHRRVNFLKHPDIDAYVPMDAA